MPYRPEEHRRKRAKEKAKAKTETERVKALEKTDAAFRGQAGKAARKAATKNMQKGRTLSDKDLKRHMKMVSKQAKKGV